VRDMILNRAAKDYDVATDARPEEVVELFARTRRIGARFGVVMVLDRGQQVEVATFRTESGYADGRHPDKVEFATARADAARRDFTIKILPGGSSALSANLAGDSAKTIFACCGPCGSPRDWVLT